MPITDHRTDTTDAENADALPRTLHEWRDLSSSNAGSPHRIVLLSILPDFSAGEWSQLQAHLQTTPCWDFTTNQRRHIINRVTLRRLRSQAIWTGSDMGEGNSGYALPDNNERLALGRGELTALMDAVLAFERDLAEANEDDSEATVGKRAIATAEDDNVPF